ncbi:unnamed protein product [Colias eurytheme]|nr:unnamed protein product [Colias eurytheme]
MSKESSPESELEATCSKFDPMKVLYSSEAKIPVKDAPVYENIQQYEAAMKNPNIAPVGHGELVKQREEEKKRKKLEEQQLLEEKNKQRFAQYKDVMPVKKERRYVNVLSRLETARGPLGALKDCVDQRLRVKVGFHSKIPTFLPMEVFSEE